VYVCVCVRARGLNYERKLGIGAAHA